MEKIHLKTPVEPTLELHLETNKGNVLIYPPIEFPKKATIEEMAKLQDIKLCGVLIGTPEISEEYLIKNNLMKFFTIELKEQCDE